MAATDPNPSADAALPRLRSARATWLGTTVGLAVLAIGLIWVDRIDIAHRLIDRQIQQLKLSARYRIIAIGTGREVLGDIAIGDPAHPDLFVKRLEITTGWNGGLPAISVLKLVGVRLRGQSSNGHLSFGSLDPVVFAPTQEPFLLPDIALTLRDSVASISGEHGPIGIAISGDGNLREGFAGIMAMVAPALQAGGCVGVDASFHGEIAIHDRQPAISGPLRMARLVCRGAGLAIKAPDLHLDARVAATFDSATAHFGLAGGAAKLGSQGAAQLAGGGDASLRNGVLAGDFTLAGGGVYGRSLRAAQLAVAGHLRASLGTGTFKGDGTLSGRGLALQAPAFATLARAQAATAGTMAAPLLASLRGGIARETAASRLSGSWIMRHSASGTSLVLPELHVDGARTPHWLALSQGMVKQAPGTARFALAGDFVLTGKGFPQVRGHIRPLANGAGVAMLSMPTWTAATTRLALPMLAVHWNRTGTAGFSGRVVLSGPVPGGQVTGLTAPLQGSWSAGAGLKLGNRCTAVGFERLTTGGLELTRANGARHGLTLCPGNAGGAMVALDGRGPRVAMRTTGIDLAGRMNGSALSIATGAAALTWPGALSVKDITIASTATPAANGKAIYSTQAAHLHLAQLTASLGPDIAGQFAGGDVSLAAMPAVVHAASGNFRWAVGRLTVEQAVFRVEDPAPQPAFAPLAVNQATLTMADRVITGTASLRATAADRELARLIFAHDIASGTGHADVTMPGLIFDKALQPKQLSALTEGVIADARGTLTGTGRFDWAHGHVTSSGRVATTGFDFAAAFGPVKGVSGQVAFTDLLGLVTAPGQTLAIASINPGIEVDDGILTFALQPGHVLVVNGARWPFLDGQMTLLPTRLVLGANEVRRYELRVDGLNAAKFLARMDLSNLAATGIFDGNMPLVFDENGGRIEQGLLLSRPPGGTVSYVGELSYKDLSPMANYAFQALRALKYRQMRIGMNGALAGDIVTRVTMQGVGQGQGARHNFITSQLARLPIQFNVNITAPFLQLVTSFRALYDPALLADPRALGLIDARGRPIAQPTPDHLPVAKMPPVIQQ